MSSSNLNTEFEHAHRMFSADPEKEIEEILEGRLSNV
jgi:hypothetical protein